MSLQFHKIVLKDISRGIDKRSTENAIADGYSEDLVNTDTNSQGFLSKRVGYEGHYGDLPLRVTEISQDGTSTITICFDDSVSLLERTPSPIVVHGRLENPSGAGDWSSATDVARYYDTYTIEARKTVELGTGTLSLTNNLGTTDLLSNMVEATSATSLSNRLLAPDQIQIDKSSPFGVDFDYTNGSGSTKEAFVFIADKSTVAGSSFAVDITWGTPAGGITFPATNKALIPAATHGLSDINIIPQIYSDTGTEWQSLIPDDFTILSNGDVEITLNPAPTGIDHKIVLADADEISEVGISGTASTTFVVNPSAGSVFFTAVYLRDLATGNRELVLPDNITYTASNNELAFTVTPPGSGVLQMMYSPGTILANCIQVTDTDSIATTFSSTSQQLSVWGIPHSGLYTTTAQGGHVTHIDSYRRELESRIFAGLGGVFHTAQTRAEAGAEYLIPSNDVTLQERTSVTKVIGPLFYTTGDSPSVTRAITADEVVGNFAEVESAAFTGTDNEVRFTLNMTNKVGDLDVSITTDDQLTVQGMAFRKLNGTFDIVSTDNSTNSIVVTINGITTSDFDETGACGKAGIFTDSLVLAATSPFIVGDEVIANVFDGLSDPAVVSVSGSTIVLSGISDELTVPGGLLLRGSRTSNTLPLSSVDNFVVGDMVTLTGFARRFRVTAVDTANNTITIDESVSFSDLESDSFLASVIGRWIPTQSPSKIQVRQYDSDEYDEQSIVRSTMVNDNLYLTNGNDEVYKFDGTNTYRAGLPRWQPQLFVELDTTTGSILRPPPLAAVSGAHSPGATTLTVDSTGAMAVDERILIGTEIYTVKSINSDTEIGISPNLISALSGGESIRPLRRLQYYFRLQAVDANQNIISSATTGANDYIVNLIDDGQVKFKCVGMPEWDAYDIDTIELQVFRADFGIGVFSRVYATSIPFTNQGYIEFTDALDEPSQADEVAENLEDQELGNTWTQPLRGKYITTVQNRTILANIKDYPEISINLRKSSGVDISTANLLNKILLVRKSSQDSGTITDMVNRANYEFVDTSTSVAISSISTTASTFTVDRGAPHNLAIGDWVYLYHSAAGVTNRLRFAGWWQIQSVPTANTFTIASDVGAVTPDANDVDRYITASDASDIPVLLGTDGNYNNTTGNSVLSQERLAMIRMANAINTTMRLTNTTISGQESFEPWIMAQAGDEIGLGNLVLRSPRADITPGIVLPAAVTNGTWVVNQSVQSGGETIASRTRLFPSRVIASFSGFNEIFDGSFGLTDDSALVFDVAPADGQEITGIMPFFAHSAFSDVTAEDMLVVFKQDSVHILDITSGQVRKLETQGIGCTAPYSIALSRNGIIFAHTSGLYRLGRDLNITYVGKYIERLWQDEIVENNLSRAVGTHYALGRQYKLSVPFGTSQTDNNQVLVYDHTRESDQRVEFGAWTRYDNHPATGWANLENNAYFGATTGRVFKLRNEGDGTDYRDDAAAITQTVLHAPMDFGLPGTVKVIRSLSLQFQPRFSDLTNTQVSSSTDLSNAFDDLDTFSLVQDTNDGGLDQQFLNKVQSIRFELPRRRAEYLQIKVVNSGFDENMILAGMNFSVGVSSIRTLPGATEVTSTGIK